MQPLSKLIRKGSNITEGWTRLIFHIRTDIATHRLEEYCKRCPVALKDGKYTNWCKVENNGCGCHTGAKTLVLTERCPEGFWADDWFKPEEFEKFRKNPNKYKK